MSQGQKNGLLLIMTIQIDENRTGRLEIFEDDDPELSAISFCNQEKLSSKVVPLLVESIKNNIVIAHKEKANMLTYLEQKKLNQTASEKNIEQSIKKTNSLPLQQEKFQASPQKQYQQQAVFDRLYQTAQLKQLKQQQSSSNKRAKIDEQEGINTQESDLDYIKQLYQRGMDQKEQLIRKAEDAKIQKKLSQFNECTYKPEINRNSVQLAQRAPEPVGQYLNKLAKTISGKKEMAQQEKIMEEQFQCSFHPQIDKQYEINIFFRSKRIIDDKKNKSEISIPHFEQLFHDKDAYQYKLDMKKEEFFLEKHTFQPQIDALSEQLVQGLTFQERQQKFCNRKERNFSAEQVFRPKTGRPPQTRPENLYDYLYSNAQTVAEKKNNVLSMSVELSNNQSRVKASQSSDIIFQQALQNQLSIIFDSLDSDQDGEIDSLRINTQTLDPSTLNILTPLLEQMKIEKQGFTKQQFLLSVMKLYNKLSNKEKHDLLKKPNKKQQVSLFNVQFIYQFQPNQNEKLSRVQTQKSKS